MDKIDLQILYELDVNARQPITAIARKVNRSKQTVHYRIQRLEENRYVNGYYALIDSTKLGFTNYRLYFKFKGLPSEKRAEIHQHLISNPRVWIIAPLAGKWDIACVLGATTINDFYSFWDPFLEKYLQFVQDYAVNIYSPVYHYPKSFLISSPNFLPPWILGEGERAKIDSIDWQILVQLSKNARMELVELSKSIDQTPESIALRIKKLEQKGVIRAYRARIDIGKLGYDYFKLEVRLKNYAVFQKLMDFCHAYPNVYQVNRTIGGSTLDIEIIAEDLQHMLGIVQEIGNRFPDAIDYIDYFQVFNELKVTYLPEAPHFSIENENSSRATAQR